MGGGGEGVGVWVGGGGEGVGMWVQVEEGGRNTTGGKMNARMGD